MYLKLIWQYLVNRMFHYVEIFQYINDKKLKKFHRGYGFHREFGNVFHFSATENVMYFIHWSYFHGCFFFLFSYNIYVNMYKSGWNKASLLSLTRCNNPHLSPLKFVYIKLLCSENNLTYYINVGVGSVMNLKWPN